MLTITILRRFIEILWRQLAWSLTLLRISSNLTHHQSKLLAVSVDLVKDKRAWAPGKESSKIPDYEKERKHEKVFCIEFVGPSDNAIQQCFCAKVGHGRWCANVSQQEHHRERS